MGQNRCATKDESNSRLGGVRTGLRFGFERELASVSSSALVVESKSQFVSVTSTSETAPDFASDLQPNGRDACSFFRDSELCLWRLRSQPSRNSASARRSKERGFRSERNGCVRLHGLGGELCGPRPDAWLLVSRKVDLGNFVLLPYSGCISSPVPHPRADGKNVNGRYGMGMNGEKMEGLGSGSATLKGQLDHPCCKTPHLKCM